MKNQTLHYPNFLVIGAGKSGTTSVYQYLKQHPQVFMSEIKEPNFFALEGKTDIIGYNESDPEGFNHYPWAVTNLSDYKALFKNVDNQVAVGESSTMYQYMDKAPANIKKHIPNAKLIAIFRNPADRLYSRYLHLAREDREPTKNFEDCFIKGNIWWQKNDLIQEGFYITHMKRYFKDFDHDKIKIFLYEDLKDNPKKLIKEMYQFLEIDESFEPDMTIKYNVSGKIRNRFFNQLIGQKSILKEAVAILSPFLLKKIKSSKYIRKSVTNLRVKNLSRPPIKEEVRKRLINEVYREEILNFQKLIGRDLSKWLE